MSRIPGGIGAGVLAWVLLAAIGCTGGEAADGGESAAVAAVTLTPSDVAVARTVELTDGVSVSGSLEPVQTVPLRAEVNARVARIHADRGTPVRRGQTLIELEGDGIRERASSARAAVASAEASLALARQRLESARRLHEAGAISDIEFRNSEAQHEAAAAALAAARAQYAAASEEASQTVIRSPIDGTVSGRDVEEGQAVRDGDRLMTVVDTRVLELRATVGVDQAMRVRVGAPVVFTIDAAAGTSYRGRVARIEPRADPGTRQVGLYSQLRNDGGRIIAGQFARGRVLIGAPAAVVAVPVTAVSDTRGITSVLVIEGDRLVRRVVTLGPRDEALGLVGVTRGVVAGERVLAVPVLGAAEGLPVRMAADSAKPAPAPGKSG